MTTDLRAALETYRLRLTELEAARDTLKAAVLAALADGESELHLEKVTGLSRNTIRKWRAAR